MSKPGYPISGTTSQTVHNTYTRSDGVVFDGTDQLTDRSVFEDKAGSNSPGWPHVLRTNDYLRSRFTWSAHKLSVHGTNEVSSIQTDHFDGDWGDVMGVFDDPWSGGADAPFSLTDEVLAIRNKLIMRLIGKIQSNRVNLGEVFATRAQCASMAANTMNKLSDAFNKLKKGNVGGALTSLTGSRGPRGGSGSGGGGRKPPRSPIQSGAGGVAGEWLAMQYGWKPLVQSVYDCCETVRKAWNDNGELFKAEAKATMTISNKSFVRTTEVPHGPSYHVETTSRKLQGKAAVSYRTANNFVASLSQLGITNPASIAWELLPYSFVVDWFLPIGPFLDALTYDQGLDFGQGFISIKASQTARQRIVTSTVTSGGITAHWSGGDASGDAFVMTREGFSEFPPVPFPQFKDPFSLGHVANALALMQQVFVT